MVKYRLVGTFLSVLGFIVIVLNATDYLMGWPGAPTGFFVFGLFFVMFGQYLSKKTK